MNAKKHDRREFIRRSTSAIAGITTFPYIIPSTVFGRNKFVAPSDKIRLGCIGVGGQGHWNMEAFLREKDVVVVALCDVNQNHLQKAKNTADTYYGNKDSDLYSDYRELLAREDIDAVSIALPDHWHGIISIAAARAGKDILGEKPLTHNLMEGRAICDAVKQYGRIWQTGS